ncbi:MAG: type II secretion system protein GspD [Spartobacteria bacterium]|nr:type II secretion system protein GspD [Spartobacteria bacterium]
MKYFIAHTTKKYHRGLTILHALVIMAMLAASMPQAYAQRRGQKQVMLNFKDSPLEMVLSFYSQQLDDDHRTMIIPPGIKASITLKSQTRLTTDEAKEALHAILAMNNITLVPLGQKFYKVVQIATASQDGMPIATVLPNEQLPDTDQMISQMVELKYITAADAVPTVQQLLHGYGKIQTLERINAMIITDTSSNIRRVLEIIQFLDRPTVTKVETRVYEIKYAEAGKIAAKLNEIIADVQEGQTHKETIQSAAATTQTQPRGVTPPGVIRARQANAQATEPMAAQTQDDVDRGMVQGKVKIIADDRTGILLVISEPSNFAFFDKIVTVLDRPVEPEIAVHIEPLEYADADEIAGLLNDFIGAAKSEKKSTGTASSAGGEDGGDDSAKAKALQNYVQNQADSRTRTVLETEKAKIGQLSDSTKILADKRTNSLMLMGRKSDIAALREVIDQLDVMLAQVLIEAVIIEVGLSDSLEVGMDWLQRSITVYDTSSENSMSTRSPVYSFAGGQNMSEGDFTTLSDKLSGSAFNPVSGALSYYATFFDLNLDVILKLAATDRNARILQTPVILTTDNTEARIIVGEQRPIVTSVTSSSSTDNQTSHYEYKDIGIEIDVTPHINPERFVVMEIKQTANNVQGTEKIDNNNVPIITKREMEAQIAVKSRSTIVLGGLVSTDYSDSHSKIPLLGDIPVLGALFRSETKSERRTELLVLITPYVLMTPEEARVESTRLKNSTRAGDTPWPTGWSDSPLATPGPDVIKAREAAAKEQLKQEEFESRQSSRQQKLEEMRKTRQLMMADPFNASYIPEEEGVPLVDEVPVTTDASSSLDAVIVTEEAEKPLTTNPVIPEGEGMAPGDRAQNPEEDLDKMLMELQPLSRMELKPLSREEP